MTLVLENIIKDHGVVADGKFVVGKVAYTTVVLPPMMETLNKPTFDLLQNFVQQGGRVITFSSPTLVDGAEKYSLEDSAWRSVCNVCSPVDERGYPGHIFECRLPVLI